MYISCLKEFAMNSKSIPQIEQLISTIQFRTKLSLTSNFMDKVQRKKKCCVVSSILCTCFKNFIVTINGKEQLTTDKRRSFPPIGINSSDWRHHADGDGVSSHANMCSLVHMISTFYYDPIFLKTLTLVIVSFFLLTWSWILYLHYGSK